MLKTIFTTTAEDEKQNTKWLSRYLSILLLVLTVIVAAIPGTLYIMRRADAQVALGNLPSEHNTCIRLQEIPHFSEASCIVIYSILHLQF